MHLSDYHICISAVDQIIMFLFIVFVGRSYSITSQRMLMQCIDSLVLKVQSGVVINFEKIGPDPSPVTNESKYNKCFIFSHS